MVAAVCQGADDMELQEVDVIVDFVLSSCQNLLVLGPFGVFRLSHLPIREYFEGNWGNLILDGISLTAYVCLRLLITSGIQWSQSSATAPLTPLT